MKTTSIQKSEKYAKFSKNAMKKKEEEFLKINFNFYFIKITINTWNVHLFSMISKAQSEKFISNKFYHPFHTAIKNHCEKLYRESFQPFFKINNKDFVRTENFLTDLYKTK